MTREFEGIWISKEIWLSKGLTIYEKIFLVEIRSLDNERGCFASNSYFSDFFGLSKSRVSEIINSLKNKGILDIEMGLGNERIMRVLLKNTYGKTEEGYSGKANRVFAKTEEGYSGKAKHNNIDINNTINNTISSKEEIYSTEICISKEKSELDLSLDQYAIMRNKMRKPMTDRAKQLLLNKMQGYTEQEQIELLEEATLKGWLSVYPKEKGYNTGKQEIMARREVLSQIKIS